MNNKHLQAIMTFIDLKSEFRQSHTFSSLGKAEKAEKGVIHVFGAVVVSFNTDAIASFHNGIILIVV